MANDMNRDICYVHDKIFYNKQADFIACNISDNLNKNGHFIK
jgi:hypothetical protein